MMKNMVQHIVLFLLLAVFLMSGTAQASGRSYISCDCAGTPCQCFIQQGDTGSAVNQIISILIEKGYLASDASAGSYSTAVEAAVKQFQSDHLLPASGVMDDDTLTLLLWGLPPEKLDESNSAVRTVYIPTDGGRKRHLKATCSGMYNPRKVSERNAQKLGFDPCKKCHGTSDIGGTDSPVIPDGLHLDEDGVFRLYRDSQLDLETYGIVEFQGGRFFVANGTIVPQDGLISDGANWYFVSLGQVADYTGLALYDSQWFFVQNGILDTARNGIVSYDGGRFMLAAGRILQEANGLIQDPQTGCWVYVSSGQVADYTGLAFYDGVWFYVVNGELQPSYIGDVEYDGSIFHVVNGQVV